MMVMVKVTRVVMVVSGRLDDAARGIFWEVEGEVKGGNQCIDDCQTDDGLQPTKDDRGKMACS